MSGTPVPFAPDALETIRRAFRSAADRRHDLVTLEHLLRALIDDPRGRAALQALNVDLAQFGVVTLAVIERQAVAGKALAAGDGQAGGGIEATGKENDSGVHGAAIYLN